MHKPDDIPRRDTIREEQEILIADYLSGKRVKPFDIEYFQNMPCPGGLIAVEEKHRIQEERMLPHFTTSLDWINPVLDKIREQRVGIKIMCGDKGYYVTIDTIGFHHITGIHKSMIEAMVEAVIQYIQAKAKLGEANQK